MSLAEALKAKAAKLKAAKGGKSVSKSEPKKAATKSSKKTASKKSTSSPRVQIKDKKGKVVTGRDNTFVCVECGSEITGPWSYKNHLVNQHDYSRAKAGLRDSK